MRRALLRAGGTQARPREGDPPPLFSVLANASPHGPLLRSGIGREQVPLTLPPSRARSLRADDLQTKNYIGKNLRGAGLQSTPQANLARIFVSAARRRSP